MARNNASVEKGKRQAERILALITEKPRTPEELVAEMGMCRQNIMNYLRKLRAGHLIYVCGYIAQWGNPKSVYAAGANPDVEYVPASRPGRRMTQKERQEQVLDLLKKRGLSTKQIAAVIYTTGSYVARMLKELRPEGEHRVYIATWKHPKEMGGLSGGDWTPIYRAGNKPDAPKPKRESSGDRHRRLAQSPEFREARNKARVLRYQVERTRKKPQGIFAALGL